MNNSLTFVIFGKEPNALKELGGALSDHKRVRLLAENNQAAQIYAEVVRLHPTAAIITLGADPEQELALLRQLAAECPETMLIGAARDTSPDLILNSLRAGAQEFLRLPLNSAEFEGVLDRAAEFAAKQATAPHRKGRVIAVFSNKGGCGTSFIASNLAIALNAPAAIVDLNLQAGDLGFYFHLEPKFTLTNLIENLTQMDDALLVNLLTPYSPSVSLLAAPRDVDASIGIQAAQVREVIEVLRKRFDYVVIDLAHLFDEVTLAALDQADDILLVLNTEIMSIRSAQRALTVFDRLDYPREKVRVIANRWDKKLLSLNWQQIERFLGKCAVSFVPDDSRAVINSINLGQPLVEKSPSAPISVEVRRLAQALTGGTGVEVKPLMFKTPALNNGHAVALNGTAMPSPLDAKSWKTRLGSIFRHN
jgi:pilus assembly protein CpaE